MGRKSTREDKTPYQLAREKCGLTLEKAGSLMVGLSPERIQKIESGNVHPQPYDALVMSETYRAPELCNYYCTHDCQLGREKIEEIEVKSFAQIAIETLNALNKLNRHKDRLLEIVEDGKIGADEYEDFLTIKNTLDKISASSSSLQLWAEGQIAEGNMDKKLFGK